MLRETTVNEVDWLECLLHETTGAVESQLIVSFSLPTGGSTCTAE
jgi:hypothetical protein